ncbi:MAG: xanthine dehydrogenase family protein molybdopterin-binding subunit [Oscillospiraceae bacterium]|nr:xanthine dehydrogenase family protein molybdopterin-binding subunit [Oscillospiraceae bacterium]
MECISKSIPKVDHKAKTSGQAMYVSDYPTDGMLFGRILRSTIAKGVVQSISLPALPDGYYFIDASDVPGINEVHIVQDDTPIFTYNVEYIGDPIGMLFGPDERLVNKLLKQIDVEYEELEPVLDILSSDEIFFEFNIDNGDTESAFRDADDIYTGDFETGQQEHMYLETNGMIAVYKDGKMLVHGSLQCLYYVHNAVVRALGLEADDVIVRQDVTGGGFGGKEDYPSVLACQTAVAAYVANGKPVRVVFDRAEDTTATSKRHPAYCNYKVALKDNKITGMIVDVLLDAGAYTTMSMVVLQRSTIAASGVYNIPNLRVRGHAHKTNTVPNGAFRGFGGPQTFFAIEMMMTHIAMDLNMDPVDFKFLHLVKQGNSTSTRGKYHFNVPLPMMINGIIAESDYINKRNAYKNQQGRFRRGIGFSNIFHGVGFTGNGERDLIKAVVKLKKHEDDRVEILTSNTDMGQGLYTTFSKIISFTLDIPMEKIIIKPPETSNVPDSGPTVASRSITIVGELLRRAALRLKDEWIDGKEQIIEQKYEHPEFMIPFDNDSFTGDAYPTYSWATTVVEVEVDTYTGYITIVDAWGYYDVGTPIDENIVIGQMEGGLVQSLGYGMMEKSVLSNGAIRNKQFRDYIVPTSVDFTGLNIRLHVDKYLEGPFGAKGAGEMSHVGGAPAVLDALQNALGVKLNKIPFMAEDVMDLLRGN